MATTWQWRRSSGSIPHTDNKTFADRTERLIDLFELGSVSQVKEPIDLGNMVTEAACQLGL
jgi:hypothetical protein